VKEGDTQRKLAARNKREEYPAPNSLLQHDPSFPPLVLTTPLGFVPAFVMNSQLSKNLRRATEIQEYFLELRRLHDWDAEDGNNIGEAMCLAQAGEKHLLNGGTKAMARFRALQKRFAGIEDATSKYEWFEVRRAKRSKPCGDGCEDRRRVRRPAKDANTAGLKSHCSPLCSHRIVAPFFHSCVRQPMMEAVLENKLGLAVEGPERLCNLSEKRAREVGAALSISLAVNQTAETAVDDWILNNRALGELDKEEVWVSARAKRAHLIYSPLQIEHMHHQRGVARASHLRAHESPSWSRAHVSFTRHEPTSPQINPSV